MEWIATFNEAVDALVATGNKEASAYLEDGLVSIPPNLVGANSNPSELFDWLQGRVRNTFTPLLSKLCEDYYNAANQQHHAFQSPQAPTTICTQRITVSALLVSKWTMKSLPAVISSLVAACQSQQQQQGGNGGAVMSALKSVLGLLSELLDALANTIRHYVFTNAKLQAHRVVTDQSSHMTEKIREHSVRDAFKNIVQIPTQSPVTVLLRAYCATYVLRFDLVERHNFESRNTASSSFSFSETIASLDHNPAYAAAVDAAADNGDESCRKLTSVLTTLMSVRGSMTDLFRCLSEDLFDMVHTSCPRPPSSSSSPFVASSGLDVEVIQPLFNNKRLDGANTLTLALFQRPAAASGDASVSSSCCAQALFANLLSSGVKEVVALVSTTTDAFAVPPALRSRIRVSLGTTLISPTSVVLENLGICLSELLNPNGDIVQQLCVAASQSSSYTSTISEEQLNQLFMSLSSIRSIIIEETSLYRASSSSTNNGENRCYFRANEQHSSILCALLECASKTLVSLYNSHQQDGVSSQAALFDFYTQITAVVSSIIGALVENGGGCSAIVVGSNNSNTDTPHDASTSVSTGTAGAYSPWSLAFWKCVRQSPILHIATTVNSIAHTLEDHTLVAVISTTAEFLAAVLHVIAEDGSCENPAPLMAEEDDYMVDAPDDECIVKQVAAGAITVSQTWASLSTTNIGRPAVTEALYEGALRIVTAMSEAAVPLLDAVVPSEDVTLSYSSNTAHERTAELGSALEAALGSIITLMKQPLENASQNPEILFGESAVSSGGGLMAALSSIILLLQATTPSNIPEADPDDDPDDFAFIIENTEEDNQRKASRLLLLADLFENIGSTLKCIISLWVFWRLGKVDWNSDTFSVELMMGHLLGGTKSSIEDAHVTTNNNSNKHGEDRNYGDTAATTTTTDALLFGADFDSVIVGCFSVFSRLSEAVGTPHNSHPNQREGPMAEVSTLLSRAIQSNFTQPDFSSAVKNNSDQQRIASAIGSYIVECITLAAAMPNVAFSLKRNASDGIISGNVLGITITTQLLSATFPSNANNNTAEPLLQAVSISQEARIIHCIVPTTSGGIHSTSISSVEYALRTYLGQLTSLGSFIQSVGGGEASSAVNASWCGGLDVVEHRALSLLTAYIMNTLDTTSHPYRDALHSRIRGWNHQEVMEGARVAMRGIANILHTVIQTHMNAYYRICLNPVGIANGVDRVVLLKSVSSINRIFGIMNIIGQFPRQEANIESFASCLGVLKQAALHAVATSTKGCISSAVGQVGRSGAGSLFQAMLDRYHNAVFTCTKGSTATSSISPVLQSEQALLQALGVKQFPILLSSTTQMTQWEEVAPTLLVLGCGAAGIACQVVASAQQQQHHFNTTFVQLRELHSHIAASLVSEMDDQHRHSPCQSATTQMMTSVLTEMMNHLSQEVLRISRSPNPVVTTLRNVMTLLMCVDASVPAVTPSTENNKVDGYWWCWFSSSDLNAVLLQHSLHDVSTMRCVWERAVVMGMCITNSLSRQQDSLQMLHSLLSALLAPTTSNNNNIDDSWGAFVVLLTSGVLHGLSAASQNHNQHFHDTARIMALWASLAHFQQQKQQQLLPWVVEACGRGGPATQPLVLVARGTTPTSSHIPPIPEFTVESLYLTIIAQTALLRGILSNCQQAVASLTAEGSLYDAVHAYQSNRLPQHHHAALHVCSNAPWDIFSAISCLFSLFSLLCQSQNHIGACLLEGLIYGGGHDNEVLVSLDDVQGMQQGIVHATPGVFSALQALRQANTMMASFAAEFKDDCNGNNHRSAVDAGFNSSSVRPLDWWLARQIPSPLTANTTATSVRDVLNGDTLADISRYIDTNIIRNATINVASMVVNVGMYNVVFGTQRQHQGGRGVYTMLQDETYLASAIQEIVSYATSAHASSSPVSCHVCVQGVLQSGVPSAIRGLVHQHGGGTTSHNHSPLLSVNNFSLAIAELAKQLIVDDVTMV